MIQPFILLSSQRSGSTFIRIWLNQHPEIHCYGEVLLGHYRSADGLRAFCERSHFSNALFKVGHSRIAKHLGLGVVPRNILDRYLQTLYFDNNHPAPWTDIENRESQLSERDHKTNVGFKLMYSTLRQYHALDNWIMEHKPKIIHVIRKNQLRKYVSLIRMQETRVAHSAKPVKNRKKVYVKTNEFLNYAANEERQAQKYQALFDGGLQYLQITYEEFFEKPVSTKQKLLDFLGINNAEMPFHKMEKIGAKSLSEDIENWDDLVLSLAGTEYENWLEQG